MCVFIYHQYRASGSSPLPVLTTGFERGSLERSTKSVHITEWGFEIIPKSNTSLILEAWLKEGLMVISFIFICEPQSKVWGVRAEKYHKENPSKKNPSKEKQRTEAWQWLDYSKGSKLSVRANPES